MRAGDIAKLDDGKFAILHVAHEQRLLDDAERGKRHGDGERRADRVAGEPLHRLAVERERDRLRAVDPPHPHALSLLAEGLNFDFAAKGIDEPLTTDELQGMQGMLGIRDGVLEFRVGAFSGKGLALLQ